MEKNNLDSNKPIEPAPRARPIDFCGVSSDMGEKRAVGRPKGSKKPDSERRVSLTIKILPYVAANIKKLPRGHLRKLIENIYG